MALEGVGSWWGTVLGAIASALPEGRGVYSVGPTPTSVAPPDLGPMGGFNYGAVAPTSGAGSPGQPPSAGIPQAPKAPTPPIDSGPGEPLIPTPSPPGLPGPTNSAGPLPTLSPGGFSLAGILGRQKSTPKYIPRARQLPPPAAYDEFGRPSAYSRRAQTIDAPKSVLERGILKRIGRYLLPGSVGIEAIVQPTELDSGELTGREVPQPWTSPPNPLRPGSYSLPKPPTDEQLDRLAGGKLARPGGAKQRANDVLSEVPVPRIARRAPIQVAAAAVGPPSPVPTQQRVSGARRATQRVRSAMSNPMARNALAAMDVLSLARRSGTRSALTTPQSYAPETPRATPDPLTPVETRGVPYLQPLTSARHDCECKSKRRGQRRKCKERADVVYSSGRRKGQRAGSKCVVYYQ